MKSAAQLLAEMPPAKRTAALRAAMPELFQLLGALHEAVGFPKDDGRWNSMVCQNLESVRKRFSEVA